MHASMRTAATTRHTASLNRYKSNKVFLRPESGRMSSILNNTESLGFYVCQQVPNVPRSMATTLVTPSAMAPSVLESSVTAK